MIPTFDVNCLERESTLINILIGYANIFVYEIRMVESIIEIEKVFIVIS